MVEMVKETQNHGAQLKELINLFRQQKGTFQTKQNLFK
jgi:hypothetical protein